MIFIYLLSGLFLGWSLGANDTGNIFGAAVETRMLRFKKAALIAALFVSLGAILEGSGPSQTLSRLGEVNALGGAFTVALAAAAAITVMVRIGIPVSTSQTIVGAIIGWNLFAGRMTDFRSLATIGGSWISAPILGAIIAALLFYAFQYFLKKTKLHLLELDLWTRYGLVAIGAFAAYSLGANNIANVVGVFVPVSPFKAISIGKLGVLSSSLQLYFLGAISIVIGIYTYSHKVMRTVGKELFRLSPVTALIAVLSEAIVLFLFASRGLHSILIKLGLPPFPLVPVSSSQVIVGAILGLGIAKGGKNLKFNILGRISLGWVFAPLMACGFSFFALFVVQNVFEQTVKQTSVYTFSQTTLMEMKRNEVNLNALSSVNGRNFTSERQLYQILKREEKFSRNEIIDIIRISELNPLKVEINKLTNQGITGLLSTAQLDDLRKLEGKTYSFRWQLKNSLSAFDSWKPIENPALPSQKEQNKRLQQKLTQLCRIFAVPRSQE